MLKESKETQTGKGYECLYSCITKKDTFGMFWRGRTNRIRFYWSDRALGGNGALDDHHSGRQTPSSPQTQVLAMRLPVLKKPIGIKFKIEPFCVVYLLGCHFQIKHRNILTSSSWLSGIHHSPEIFQKTDFYSFICLWMSHNVAPVSTPAHADWGSEIGFTHSCSCATNSSAARC